MYNTKKRKTFDVFRDWLSAKEGKATCVGGSALLSNPLYLYSPAVGDEEGYCNEDQPRASAVPPSKGKCQDTQKKYEAFLKGNVSKPLHKKEGVRRLSGCWVSGQHWSRSNLLRLLVLGRDTLQRHNCKQLVKEL